MTIGILDIILLAVILITCIISYKKGLLLTVYKIVSIFIAIALAWGLNSVVKSTLKATPIEPWINKQITVSMEKSAQEGTKEDKVVEGNEKENQVEELKVPKFIKKYLNEEVDKAKEDTKSAIKKIIVEKLTDICLTIISFVVVMLATTIVLSLIKGILQFISDIPIIDSINKLLGGAFGIVVASFKIWVAFLIIGLFINVEATNGVYSWIVKSPIANWYYNNNLLSYVIVSILG